MRVELTAGAGCRRGVLGNSGLDTLHRQPMGFPLDARRIGQARRERFLQVRREVDLVVGHMVYRLVGAGCEGDVDCLEGGLGEGPWGNEDGLRVSIDTVEAGLGGTVAI